LGNNFDFFFFILGAGTCLEALRLKKKFIVVINDSLMDNHQIDLYEALTKNFFCYGLRSPSELKSQVRKSFGFFLIFNIIWFSAEGDSG
jgi:UDP-N-acetylglucosamine transferase subunit ALG13